MSPYVHYLNTSMTHHLNSGPSILIGPERASILAAIQHLTTLPDVGHLRGSYWVPLCSGTGHISDERRAKLRAIGFLSMLYIVRVGSAPHPVHPLLLWMCLDGRNGVGIDDAFLRRVDGALANTLDKLEAWDGKLASLSVTGEHPELGILFRSVDIDVSLPSQTDLFGTKFHLMPLSLLLTSLENPLIMRIGPGVRCRLSLLKHWGITSLGQERSMKLLHLGLTTAAFSYRSVVYTSCSN